MKTNYLFIITLMCLIFTHTTTAQTTIVVDWAIDEEPGNNYHTCTYTQGSFFLPDTSGSGAGKCTLRRALREAGARSDDSSCPGCTPVHIVFSGLDGTNGDSDDSYYSLTNDQWTIPVSSAVSSSNFMLKPQSITDVDGPIIIRGFAGTNVLNGDMPKIMIDTKKTLEIEISDVTIKNLGFMGGISIRYKEANGIFKNNTWGLDTDGMSIKFKNPGTNDSHLAGTSGIATSQKADDLLIQGNIITGASSNAISINSGTTGVQILDNLIGTRIDGSVPEVPDSLKCRTFTNPFTPTPALDANEWFGGYGITAAGTGLIIQGNTLVGMQNMRSASDTPPGALRILGSLHTIEDNIFGKDLSDNERGICGQAIQISTQTDTTEQNNGHLILNNEIYSPTNGFSTPTGVIYWSDTHVSSYHDGGNTIRGNIIKDGLTKSIEIGANLTQALKAFEPAIISSISGVNISGHSHTNNAYGDPSPCPDCIIDFYLDDGDSYQEALEYLGSTVANSSGDFTFTLSSPLTDGYGIRTTSTSVDDDVLPDSWAGQTSEMSIEVYGLIDDVIYENGFE